MFTIIIPLLESLSQNPTCRNDKPRKTVPFQNALAFTPNILLSLSKILNLKTNDLAKLHNYSETTIFYPLKVKTKQILNTD